MEEMRRRKRRWRKWRRLRSRGGNDDREGGGLGAEATEGGTCKCIFFSFILFYLILFLIPISFQFWCSGGGGDSGEEAEVEEANGGRGGGGGGGHEGGRNVQVYIFFVYFILFNYISNSDIVSILM